VKLGVQDGVDGFLAQLVNEIPHDIGEEGVRGHNLLRGAAQGGLEGVYVVSAEALGQLDYAPDAVFDLHDMFKYVLYMYCTCDTS
jgi:hypothetical protein